MGCCSSNVIDDEKTTPTPYVALIPGGMQPGKMVRFQGTVPPGATRFAINFQCGPNTDPRDNIALHMNFRFQDQVIVRNHLQNYQWGSEEMDGGFPLKRGTGFEILVLAEMQSFRIAVNGQHFCEFRHRLPLTSVTHLTHDGDIQMNAINFEGGSTMQPQQGYSPPPPAYGPPPPAYGAPPQQAYGQPAYGAPPQAYAYGPPPPAYAGQAQQGPYNMMSSQSRGGVGTGTAVGLGLGGLAAGGLAGYALGGGFSSDSPPRSEVVEETTVVEDSGDFGGDDWMD